MVAESKQQIRETSLELLSSDTIKDPIGPLTQRAMFWRPAYLESSAWIEHIPFAFWLVEAHQPHVFVELGAHYGVSYFAFCQAVEKLELDSRCFAVDTWKGDEQAGFYDERVFEQVKAYNEAQYSGFSRLVRSSFDDALPYFSDGSIDLLHIDGLHTFEAASYDFESWLPKLSERAVVVMHDTNVRERKFGVFKLFESLKERYSAFEFIHGQGLGVLKVGPRQTDQMLRLFRSAEKDQSKHAVHEAFSRLGRACGDSFSAAQQKARAYSLKDQAEKQKKQLKDVKQSLEKNKTDLHKRTKELADIRIQMQTQFEQHAVVRGQLDEQVTLLQETDNKQRVEIKILEMRLVEAERELAAAQKAQEDDSARHKNDMSSREAEVERLTETVSILQQEQDLSQGELAGHNEIVERLEENLATQAADTRLHKENLAGRAEEIERLNQALVERENELIAMQHTQQAQAAEMEALQQDLESRSEEIGREQWYLGERDAEIGRLTETLAAREQELYQAQSDLSERNEAAERLQLTLDEHLAEAQTLNAALADKSEENEDLTRRLSEQDAALKDAHEAIEAREEEVENYEQERKGHFKANVRLEQMVKERELELTEIRDKQARLINDHQMQLEQAQQAHQTLEAANNEAAQENELLLQQLHQVQEELEEIFLRNQDRKQAHQRLETANKQAAQENETLSRKLQQVREDVLTKDGEIEKQRQRVTKLKQTVSWKITAPMRGIARPFKRPNTEQKKMKTQVKLLKTSGLFDEAWYLAEYTDVASEGVDPVEHYLRHGAAEGRNPSSVFNTQFYLESNPDVAATELNPLIHFVKFGRAEGRTVLNEA